MLGALGLACQTLPLGHDLLQGGTAFLHALFQHGQPLLHGILGLLARRAILDGQQDQRLLGRPVGDLAGIEPQHLPPEAREVVLHHKVLDDRVVRQDVLQELAQGGDVPVAVAQVIEQAALSLGGRDLEHRVERAVRGLHAQAGIEDQQRLADRVDEALGIGLGRAGGLFGVRQGGHVDKRQDHPVNDVRHRPVGQEAHQVLAGGIRRAHVALLQGERAQHLPGVADEVGAVEA